MRKGKIVSIFIFFVCLILFNQSVYADNYNPSREELETKIENVAIKRGIPSILLKAIARVETVFKHYDENGNVNRGSSGSIGLMQVLNLYNTFDTDKLMYDIEYNIEAGAEILLNKWDMCVENKIPTVGNMDPNILENWYFALWAYNGWVESNNPNMMPYHFRTWVKKHTYQDLIYMVAEKEYSQKISNIDFSCIPSTGLPNKTLNVPLPENINYANIVNYDIGDIVKVDTINTLNMRDAPFGKIIGKIENEQIMIVGEEPILKNGYYWYHVVSEDSTIQGWAARNWLVRIGDSKNGIYPFKDIAFHWGRDYIMKLYNQNYVNGDSETTFSPDRIVNREEFSAFISKALKLTETEELLFNDIEDISPWAVKYISKVCNKGLYNNEEIQFKPKEQVTRKEAALVISKVFQSQEGIEENELNENSNETEQSVELIDSEQTENKIDEANELQFIDITELTSDEINAIKICFENNIMNGKSQTLFCPDDILTRAEIATIMYRLINQITTE